MNPYPEDEPIYSPGWIPCNDCEVLIPLDSMGNPYQHTCKYHTVMVTVTDPRELDEWWNYI
jgi:hypothetical protein